MRHQEDKVTAFIEEQGLVCAMNDTKWRELVRAMRAAPEILPCFRRKDLFRPEPDDDWDAEWFYHPLPYRTIEWLEIRVFRRRPHAGRAAGTTEDIAQVRSDLRQAGIPFSVSGPLTRVWGYYRRTDPPRWDHANKPLQPTPAAGLNGQPETAGSSRRG